MRECVGVTAEVTKDVFYYSMFANLVALKTLLF